jgi:hypothetical protein
MVVGGYEGANYAIAELYDSESNTWSTTGSLANARGLHTATYMPNGRIMVVGGMGDDATVPMTTEIY